MDLSLTESQEMLKAMAREFMEKECPKPAILQLETTDTGCSEDIWAKAAQAGWLGIAIPQEYGGEGSSLTDAAVLFEELGRGPLWGPFFSSCILGAFTVLEAGSEAQKRQVLPQVAQGKMVLALAATEPDYGWGPQWIQMEPKRQRDGYVLTGSKLFVHDALAATHLICAVRTAPDPVHGITLLLVDRSQPGISARNLPGFLGWMAEVKFDAVEVPASAVLGHGNDGWPALERATQRAIPVLCAYQVGGCQAVFDMSAEYSRTRVQFGTPIGRLQRVQDHIINLVNQLDAARWTTFEALWKLDAGRPAAASVHLAKAVASTAYHQACNHAHEVHAGSGTIREYGLNIHTKMSRTLYDFLGDPRYHRRRLADALAW